MTCSSTTIAIAEEVLQLTPPAECTHERGHIINCHKFCQWCHNSLLNIRARELAEATLREHYEV